MFDLGRTLLAVVERSPDALAIVDGERRLSYAAWYREIGRVGGGLAALGLSRRDRQAGFLPPRGGRGCHRVRRDGRRRGRRRGGGAPTAADRDWRRRRRYLPLRG